MGTSPTTGSLIQSRIYNFLLDYISQPKDHSIHNDIYQTSYFKFLDVISALSKYTNKIMVAYSKPLEKFQ